MDHKPRTGKVRSMSLLCRLGIHTQNLYLTIRAGLYALTCKRCGKETT